MCPPVACPQPPPSFQQHSLKLDICPPDWNDHGAVVSLPASWALHLGGQEACPPTELLRSKNRSWLWRVPGTGQKGRPLPICRMSETVYTLVCSFANSTVNLRWCVFFHRLSPARGVGQLHEAARPLLTMPHTWACNLIPASHPQQGPTWSRTASSNMLVPRLIV